MPSSRTRRKDYAARYEIPYRRDIIDDTLADDLHTGRYYMANDTEKATRLHKATYAQDKRGGGYLVRVTGPMAARFAGRSVPVTRLDGSESTEKLGKLVWSGIDSGEYGGTKGSPAALYQFEQKPREPDPEPTF